MSGRSRGFAILKFADLQQSQAAIASMHKCPIGGRALEVCTQLWLSSTNCDRTSLIFDCSYLKCRDDRGRSFDASTKRAIFVGKLEYSMTDETLSALFSEAGVVKSAKIQMKSDGFPRGWGWVTYSTTTCVIGELNPWNWIQSSPIALICIDLQLNLTILCYTSTPASWSSTLLRRRSAPSSSSTVERRPMDRH